MHQKPIVLTSILLLVLSIIAAANLSVPAHGSSTGVVCIIPDGSTSCPSSPAQIAGTVGSQIRVAIFVQNSSGLNGFDIILLGNHTVLKPVGIDLTGSVLASPQTILLLCESGILKQGSTCSSVDNVDTLHFVASAALGTGITATPTTGLLFTALYNVTSASSATPLSFQTGCTTTSVGSSTCVTVANGTPTAVPESVQTAIFSSNNVPDFAISANPASLSIVEGSSASSTITVTSVNGFSGAVNLFVPSPPLCSQPGCSGWSINPTTVTLSPGGTATASLSIFAGTVFPGPGKSLGIPVNGTSDNLTHTVVVTFTTIATDFAISASPASITLTQGGTATSAINLASVGGFAGTIVLSSSSSPAGLTVSLTPTSISLSSGSANSSILQVPTTNATAPGTYTVTVTGTSGSVSHTVTVTIVVNSSTTTGDFTITDSATFISIPTASERQTIVTVTSVNGFVGNVQLLAIPSSHAFACWFTTLVNSSTVFVPAGGSATQYPTCAAGRPAGTYTLTITGTSGSISHSATLTVNVADYSMTGPSSIAFNAGSSTVEALTFASLSGFAGTIMLSFTGPSAISVSCPASVTLSSGSTATPTCSLTSTLAGTYNVTYTGTFVCTDCYFNGKDVNTLSTIVTVFVSTAPDFSISLLPGSLTIPQGSSGSSTILASSIQGFAGTINLAVTVSPGGPSLSLNPASITLSPGGNGTSTLTVSTTASTPAGSYTIIVTGSSGSLSHSASMALSITGTPVPDFSLSANPNSITISPNTSGTSSIKIASINGFSSVVSLTVTVPQQLTATLTPTSITGSGTATLTVTGSTVGTFTLQVTGASGTIAHSVTVSVTVAGGVGIVCIIQSGATSCPASPAALTGTVGTQLRVSVFIQNSGPLNGFDVTLLADHTILLPAGIDLTGTVLLGTPTIVDECRQGILIQGTVCSPTDTIDTLHLVAVNALGSGLTSNPTTGLLFTAIYNITGTTSSTSLAFQTGCSGTSVSGNICVDIANGTPAPVPATVQTATFSNSGPASDFAVTSTPSSLTISAGACAVSTVTVTSINGFSGTITFTASVSPTGLTATLAATSVSLSSGMSAGIPLTVCATSQGSFVVTVTATSGSISHSTLVSVTVTAPPDFTITATPTSQTIRKGSSATYTITVKGTNGFNGTVTLSTTVSPLVKNGPTVSLPSNVGPYSNSTLTLSTTRATPVGTYTITVTASSGSITHKVTVTVAVTK